MNFILRTLIALLAFTIHSAATAAAEPKAVGDWHGQLAVPGGSLRLVVHIESKDSALTGKLDSPDQGANGIPLGAVTLKDGTLEFTVPSVGGRFAGKWSNDQWVGEWIQGPALPLTLQPFSVPVAKDTTPPPDHAQLVEMVELLAAKRPGIFVAASTVGPMGTDIVRSSGLAPGQRFEIGSITKTFTGLLLADMVLDGKVKLDDPVAQYLPPDALPEAARAITLRQLSQHRSGLPRMPANMAVTLDDPYAAYDDAKMLAYLREAKLGSTPGTKFEYSNLGVGLLGYVLGRVDGRGYLPALQARVMAPLGMKDTNCDLDDRTVPGHDLVGKVARPWMFKSLAPAGCLRSTIEDMTRFANALVDPKSAIAPEVALIQRETGVAENGMAPGLGILKLSAGKSHFWFHNGATGGFKSLVAFDPASRQAMVLLTNSFAPTPDQTAMQHFFRMLTTP